MIDLYTYLRNQEIEEHTSEQIENSSGTKKNNVQQLSRYLIASFIISFILVTGLYQLFFHVNSIFAESATSVTKNSDTHFSAGTATDTSVSGSGTSAVIQLSGSAGPDNTQYRKKITFDNTTVNLGVTSENQTNFPVLIKLESGTDIDYSKTQDNGEDIRFLDADDSTVLSYEIEEWNESGTSYVWVKVPQIDINSSTDFIYLYYGSASAVDEQSPTGVWGTNYSVVYHLNEPVGTSGTGSVGDSTSNSSGTPSTGIVFGQSGAISTTANFSSGTGINIGSLGSPLLTAATTVSFWINTTNFSSPARQNPFNQAYGGWGTMTIETTGVISWFFGSAGVDASPYGAHQSNAAITNSSWINITAVRDPSGLTYKWYKNGVYLNGSTYSSSYPVINTLAFTIGDGYVSPINGRIDEFRVAKAARSAAWIAASYKSETDSYATIGTEETRLSPSGSWESPSDSNVIDIAYNGGWGDGTDGSTAFSATVADVTAASTITFKMRGASTTGGLSSATYYTLGTVNSGTTFTRTKAQLDALGIPTGSSGRYLQVKAEFAQTDGNNPKLDDFTISYMADNTAPGTNATAIVMTKTNGGASILSNGWTNDLAPYFSWTAGADSQAGLKGYCLYLGQTSSGDPSSTKGLLGTSPVSTTGTTCQFIISTALIDFVTTGYRGSTWLTSSSDPYYLNIKAVDNMGNVYDGASTQFQFRFDNTSPGNPSYLTTPSDYISTEAATILWPSSGADGPSDSNAGVAGLQYRIGDSGTWYGDSHTGTEDSTDLLTNDGSYVTNATYDYPVLTEGSNLIYLRTWDSAGNVSSTYVSSALKINTSAPSVPQNLAVTPSDATTNSYAFSWSAPATYEGQASGITYCYTVNTLPTASTCTFTAAGATSLSADAFATQPGTNTLYLVARDEAENINYDVYTSVTFTYSGSAPGIPTNVDIADISIKASSSWKLAISWTAPTDVGAGVSSYKIYRSITATSCSSSFSSFTYIGSTSGTSYSDTGLSQQYYYYCIKACDSANSCSAVSSTVNMYPDGKYTSAAGLSSGPTVSSITTKKATITWATDRTADSRVQYGTSTGSYFTEEVSNSSHVTSHTITLTNLSAGTTYYFKAKYTDEDGNTGTSSENTFTTDPAPVVKNVSAKSIGITNTILEFTVTSATKVKIYYGSTTSFGGLKEMSTSLTETTYTSDLTGLSDGTKYYYKIDTVDEENEEYQGTILDFETLPMPKISLATLHEAKGAATPTVLVTWDTNTAISSIVTFYPKSDPGKTRDEIDVNLKSGAHTMFVRNLIPNSDYLFIISGRDKIGTEAKSSTISYTTASDTRPPQISDLGVEADSMPMARSSDQQSTAQLIVAWNTDEPSTSQVEYGEGTGNTYSQKTQEDQSLTYNHLVVISGLTPSKVYHLRALSKDKAENVGNSIDTVTITPKAVDNALDLVISNLREAFGFLK